MSQVVYGTASDVTPQELLEFYERVAHPVDGSAERLGDMLSHSAVVVTARAERRLIGLARGASDGLRGFFTECKLDPQYQGPAAVTKRDGRIEHDSFGIAREMAQRVIDRLHASGAARIDVLAWGTEVDFLEELGFKRNGGLVALSLRPSAAPAQPALAGATA